MGYITDISASLLSVSVDSSHCWPSGWLLRASTAVAVPSPLASDLSPRLIDWQAAFTKPNFHPQGVRPMTHAFSSCFLFHTGRERERERIFNKDISNSMEETNKKVCYREVEFEIVVVMWPVTINPLNAELNPICYLLALLGAHHFLHVSRIRVKLLTLRRLMSYIYGAPILDVSRSHTTTQHSR